MFSEDLRRPVSFADGKPLKVKIGLKQIKSIISFF